MNGRLVLLGAVLICVALVLPAFPLVVPAVLLISGSISLVVGLRVMRAMPVALLSAMAVLAALSVPVLRRTSFNSFVVRSQFESRIERAREAAEKVASANPKRRWPTCALSLESPVHVKVAGLDVWLPTTPVAIPEPRFFNTGELFVRGLFGSMPELPTLPEHERLIVGTRRDYSLVLRMVDLATNRIECEGRTILEDDDIEGAITRRSEPLTQLLIADMLNPSLHDTLVCINGVRVSNPGIEGQVVFTFVVDEAGKAGEVTTSQFAWPEAADCVASQLAAFRFPAEPGRAPQKFDFKLTMPEQ